MPLWLRPVATLSRLSHVDLRLLPISWKRASSSSSSSFSGSPTDRTDRTANLWAEKWQNRIDSMDQVVVQRERIVGRKADEDTPEDARQAHMWREVAKLGRERRWQDALAILAEAGADAGPKLRTAALTACADSMELRRGRIIFQEMPVKVVPACNAYIMLLGRMRQREELADLLSLMREQQLRPTEITYGCLMNAYGLLRDMAGAMKALKDMRAEGMKPSLITFGNILAACAKSGEKQQAVALLRDMEVERLVPNLRHYTSIVASCSRSKDEGLAREMLQEMRQRNLEPSVMTYTSLVGCLSGPGAQDRAAAIQREMAENNVVPDMFFFHELIEVSLNAGNAQRCRELLDQAAGQGLADTKETALKRHRINELERDQVAASTAATAPAATIPQGLLPQGWSQARDPASGLDYYWQEANPAGTTTWERPRQ